MSFNGLLHQLASRKNALEYTSPYSYTPSLGPSVAYLVLFSVFTIIHVALGVRYKYWIVFVTLVPGGVLEIVGWAGRLWSHQNVLNSNPFIMQICTLILGPAFYSAWAYTILGFCITRLGSAYSLIKPRLYLIIFVTADIISLVLQAIGGGSAATKAKLGEDTDKATKIMLAGILFQMGTMVIFTALAADFIVRVLTRRPYSRRLPPDANPSSSSSTDSSTPNDPEKATRYPEGEGNAAPGGIMQTSDRIDTSAYLRKAEYLLGGVAFASLMIFIRGIYRSVELAQGWTGYVITHEDYFTYLDGLPMILCFAALAVAHPGWLLPRRQGWKNA